MGNTLLWLLVLGVAGYFIWTKVVMPNAEKNLGKFVQAHPKFSQNIARDIRDEFGPQLRAAHYGYSSCCE